MNFKIFLLILFIIVTPDYGYTQLPKTFKRFDQVDGLPDNNVKAIIQDKYGYIWLGTENGLARFDGRYFTVFESSKNLAPLPSSNIDQIYQLDSNHLAIVTYFGLNIIDVENMTSSNLIIPKGPIFSEQKANRLNNLLSDAAGNIFLVSRSGFYHFNKERKLVFRYDDYTTEESKSPMAFSSWSYWLTDERIVMSGKKGYHCYNTRTHQFELISRENRFFQLFPQLLRFQKRQDFYIVQPAKGKFILLNYYSDTLTYIDETRGLVTHSTINLPNVYDRFSWRSNLFTISDSGFYLSGKFDGLYQLKIHQQTGSISLDTQAIFANKKVNALLKDKRGKYWIGADDGIHIEKNSPINLQLTNPQDRMGASTERTPVLQVAVMPFHIYAAAAISGGLQQFNKSTLEFVKTIPFQFPAYANKSLSVVEKKNDDTVLAGTGNGLYLYDEKKQISSYVNMPGWDMRHNWVADLFVDSKKNVWINTNQTGGCYIWKPTEKNPQWLALDSSTAAKFGSINHTAEDNEGNIWLAGQGLARYNKRKQAVDLFLKKLSDTEPEPAAINAIEVDAAGNVWLADVNAGLVCYDPVANNTKQFTLLDGLPDEKLNSLKYYKGHIWMTFKNGIAKINCQTKKITSVANLKDVDYQNLFSNKLSFDIPSSSFYTGAGSSVIRFDPENRQYYNPGPRLHLVFVKTGTDSTIWFPPPAITVSWKKRNLSLFYNAINFEDAGFQKYAYRTIINGEASAWIKQDDQRRIVFTDMRAGKTIIEIKVYSPQNAWPEKTITFTVKVIAPFWKTAWFQLICITALLAILYSIYKYRTAQAKKIVKIRDDISKDLHDEIGATLSGIAMYGHMVKDSLSKNDIPGATYSVNIIRDSAADMVTKLNDIIWIIKPQHESLESVIERLKLYASDMCPAKNINPEFIISAPAVQSRPSLEARKNIYLFCKEAINNALKYSKARLLRITVQLRDNNLVISIQDNGVGFDMQTVKKGNGLDNFQKRAAEMKAGYTLQTAPGSGCIITLTLKITPKGIV